MNGLCATETTISSNNDAALSILNAFGNGTGRKTSENHRMHGANACAGKHSYGQFRHHGQVNPDPVALFGTVLLQHICRSEEQHVCTPVTTAHLVCRPALENKHDRTNQTTANIKRL